MNLWCSPTRRIQQLQTKATKLRRQLKAMQIEISRHEKRMLRPLARVMITVRNESRSLEGVDRV